MWATVGGGVGCAVGTAYEEFDEEASSGTSGAGTADGLGGTQGSDSSAGGTPGTGDAGGGTSGSSGAATGGAATGGAATGGAATGGTATGGTATGGTATGGTATGGTATGGTATGGSAGGAAADKPRVVVTTDGEIDDQSSMKRFLLYASDYTVEGIVATNSKWQQQGHGTGWINDDINAYAKVLPNLLLHHSDYPSADYLRGKVVLGNEDWSKANSIPSVDTDGSKLIVNVLLDSNPAPVWLLAWGGTNTIAQALYRIKQSHAADASRALAKAMIYAISTQDDTANYIRDHVPEVVFILDGQFWPVWAYQNWNYHEYGSYTNPTWKSTHIVGHGALADRYYTSGVEEGDSPSFLGLIASGLRSTADPSWGGWGGRHTGNGHNYYDASDDGDSKKPMKRWIPAVQNDFQARLDWCTKSFAQANHAPVVSVSGGLDRSASPGETVSLVGSASDPDGHSLSAKWWQYYDADSASAKVSIQNSTSLGGASFVAPNEPGKTVHVILEVTDNGSPTLTRYQRVVVTIR
jgi:hypothetical protein